MFRTPTLPLYAGHCEAWVYRQYSGLYSVWSRAYWRHMTSSQYQHHNINMLYWTLVLRTPYEMTSIQHEGPEPLKGFKIKIPTRTSQGH